MREVCAAPRFEDPFFLDFDFPAGFGCVSSFPTMSISRFIGEVVMEVFAVWGWE